MIGKSTAETDALWARARSKHGITATHYHCSTLADTDCIDLSVPTLDLSEQVQLICAGKKRGTAHLRLDFEVNGVPRRNIGDYWMILDLDIHQQPYALVHITDIYEKPFDEVPESFAIQEGEGDLSLDFWREAHYEYFVRMCEKIGVEWSEQHIVVCESFSLVEPYR